MTRRHGPIHRTPNHATLYILRTLLDKETYQTYTDLVKSLGQKKKFLYCGWRKLGKIWPSSVFSIGSHRFIIELDRKRWSATFLNRKYAHVFRRYLPINRRGFWFSQSRKLFLMNIIPFLSHERSYIFSLEDLLIVLYSNRNKLRTTARYKGCGAVNWYFKKNR